MIGKIINEIEFYFFFIYNAPLGYSTILQFDFGTRATRCPEDEYLHNSPLTNSILFHCKNSEKFLESCRKIADRFILDKYGKMWAFSHKNLI